MGATLSVSADGRESCWDSYGYCDNCESSFKAVTPETVTVRSDHTTAVASEQAVVAVRAVKIVEEEGRQTNRLKC